MNPHWIKCQTGWVRILRLDGGRYYVTATRHRAQTVFAGELNLYVDELVRALGGRALGETAQGIVDSLLRQ